MLLAIHIKTIASCVDINDDIIDDLHGEGLILFDTNDRKWQTTPKGYCFIDYLLHLPLPEQVTEWKMPD
jgi:predicted transcriptional regulator